MSKLIPINCPIIGREEEENILSVLRSGLLTVRTGEGKMVSEFEKLFSDFIGVKYAIAVSSGTAALHASLLALNVKAGDEVILPSFTFSATCNVVLHLGAKPVFVDINLETYTLDVNAVKKSITDKTKIIIPVHLYGHPADLAPLTELAEEENIYIVEDAAQAHGAEYNGSKVGCFGQLGCFSFYPTKMITTGEGGMITTNDRELAEKIKMIRNHGEKGDYGPSLLGHNWRLPEISAAIGVAQMRKINHFLEARRRNANHLTSLLEDMDLLVLPVEKENVRHAWNLYTVRLKERIEKRDEIVSALRRKGIGATVYYPIPVHRTPLYRKYGYNSLSLPNSEFASKTVFSLPVHPALTEDDVSTIAYTVKKTLEEYR
ncbi:MAG: DegT/DnrJ/EryC1/StrS family aminotransferase [Candidatus Freyarchaeota archaeon]|nr:DegT/DnrJ/EryC1/StrS family aminotransferase [Candidatus Freyrarchaeum guaymaensis]